jgi:type III pantothenate kinase
MILTIDIGNTTISFGLMKNVYRGRFFSCLVKDYSKTKLWELIKKNLKCDECVDKTIISSVVPHLSQRIKADVSSILKCPTYLVGKDIACDIKHRYKNIKKLGIDRKVAIYGVLHLYDVPFLVIDFGTAITFDVVNKKGVFEGGLITPGMETSFRALAERAAQLPKNLIIEPPKTFFGRDTKDGMIAGIVYGVAALTEGLISRVKKHFGSKLRVIATGGAAQFISTYCMKGSIDVVDPHLVLKGLFLLQELRNT